MKNTRNCTHCSQLFESRRSNHVYCTASCKTKASYKRNAYKYVSGHYQKEQVIEVDQVSKMVNTNDVLESIRVIEARLEHLKPSNEISGISISNSAIGSATANAAVYAAKKMFAPSSLPATKGDIEMLINKLNQLKSLMNSNSFNKFPFEI